MGDLIANRDYLIYGGLQPPLRVWRTA